MFQFPGFALKTLCIQVISTWLTLRMTAAPPPVPTDQGSARSGRLLRSNNQRISGGFPHSEIHGSKLILSSPWLIAEYHVLHRLLLPRHPPNALIALDLIRKKKDPSSRRKGARRSRVLLHCAGVASGQKHVRFPPFPKKGLCPVRRRNMVSVLDLDNAVVGPPPEGRPPLQPHLA